MRKYIFPIHREKDDSFVKKITVTAESQGRAEGKILRLLEKKPMYFDRPEVEEIEEDLPDSIA